MSSVFIRTENIVRKDESIFIFDKFDVLGNSWEIILDELLVNDVIYKFWKSLLTNSTQTQIKVLCLAMWEVFPISKSFLLNSTLGSIRFTTNWTTVLQNDAGSSSVSARLGGGVVPTKIYARPTPKERNFFPNPQYKKIYIFKLKVWKKLPMVCKYATSSRTLCY